MAWIIVLRMVAGGCAGFVAAATMLGSAACAAPLTCDKYREHLDAALVSIGGKDAKIGSYSVGFTSPTRGQRFDWTGDGVSGTLSCGPAGQFEEFTVSIQFTKQEQFSDLIGRMVLVSGGAVCALVTDPPGICGDVGRAMLKDGLEQIGRAHNRGAQLPSGLSDRDVLPGVQAEMSVAPSLISFVIGPGRGSSTDEARRPLSAIDTKTKPAK